MEDRRVLIIAIVMLVCMPLQVTAYSNYNIGGHPSINKFAIQYFEEKILPFDPLLNGTSISGKPTSGYAWDETDGDKDIGPRTMVNIKRNKLVHQWIEDGGYSADEPERTMALVHFYDPVNPGPKYLTDQKFLQEVGELWYGQTFSNPRISAVDWAFDTDLGWGYFIQDYSWNDGLRYYKDALADPSRDNYNYGQAWRAVGETMHLVSDMTVPAHVRNDGHPSFMEVGGDPYENSVGSGQVYAYKDGKFLNLNYDQGTLQDLMVHIATEVNRNFYSADTMPVQTETGVAASYIPPRYNPPQPTLEGELITLDEQGYYYSPVAGALTREEQSNLLLVGESVHLYRIDKKVLDAQRRVLIPTAIRASAEVLDRFLPRFDAKLSIEKYLPEDPDDKQYIVHSTLKQVHSEPDAWRGTDLIVRNGAYMVVKTPDGQQKEWLLSTTPVWASPPPDPSFNDWMDLFKFDPGTEIYMKYDLGGYVIQSDKVVIPKPEPTTAGTSAVPTTATPVVTGTRVCANTAACTPAHPELCCPGTTFDDSPCAGCELCCYLFNEDNVTNKLVCTPPWEKDAGVDVEDKYNNGCWMLRAFCSCETGEDVDTSSYNTNPWAGVPGYS
jgi:hypothetical protein